MLIYFLSLIYRLAGEDAEEERGGGADVAGVHGTETQTACY